MKIGDTVYVLGDDSTSPKMYKTTIKAIFGEVCVLDLPYNREYLKDAIFSSPEKLFETLNQSII